MARFSSTRRTRAMELPATAMGRQCPTPKSRMSSRPVSTCFWMDNDGQGGGDEVEGAGAGEHAVG